MSTSKRIVSSSIASLIAGLAWSCTAAYAADVSQDAGGVHLAARQSAQGHHLRVVGPKGFLFEQTVAGNKAMFVQHAAGGWADGDYRYEITAVQGDFRRFGDESMTPSVAAVEPESGSFSVRNGAVLLAGGVEPSVATTDSGEEGPVTDDQVIADDLIVQGSACVGLDCVNNESFGFDTLRLKENNTRIKFEDTSVGSFPSTDWQLTANDSASGGQNKFSIEDITAAKVPFTVTGNAPTNSLFIDSSGRLGLRTSTPVLDLHIATSNTPGIRLEQNSSGGFSAQTWDVSGNEANFFVRDVTSGSRLPFRIRPGAPTSSIDINASGNVGVGIASPTAKLHVNASDGTAQVLVTETNATASGRDMLRIENNGPTRFRLKNTATNNEWSLNAHDSDFRMTPAGSAVVAMTIFPTGNVTIAGTLSQNSDRTTKENFKPLDQKELLDRIAALEITEWNFKYEDASVRHVGPMAQDFHKVFGLGESDNRIAPLDTSGVALAAVQALQNELVSRDKTIAELQTRLDRLDKLTQQLAAAQQQTAASAQVANHGLCTATSVNTDL